MIVAKGRGNVIGNDNELIWSLPKDLQHFKEKTEGKVILMGRKTFESIGRVLPGRKNIILTRDKEYKENGIEVIHDIQEINKLKELHREVVIIGGEEVYKQAIEYADTLYVTDIVEYFKGDTFFPTVRGDKWELVYIEKGLKDKENPYDYYFKEYKRK